MEVKELLDGLLKAARPKSKWQELQRVRGIAVEQLCILAGSAPYEVSTAIFIAEKHQLKTLEGESAEALLLKIYRAADRRHLQEVYIEDEERERTAAALRHMNNVAAQATRGDRKDLMSAFFETRQGLRFEVQPPTQSKKATITIGSLVEAEPSHAVSDLATLIERY